MSTVAGGLALPADVVAAPSTTSHTTAALNADRVYFEETGHGVSGAFWRFWRTYGLEAFGYPITEVFADGGVPNQYFQRARFELTPNNSVRLGLLGIEMGGAEPVSAEEAGPAGSAPAGSRVIPETGHTVAGAFLGAYDRWRAVLGPPVGVERAVGSGYMQYFSNARLEWDPTLGTRLGLLGSEAAERRQVDTAPVSAPADMVKWGDVLTAMTADERERRALGAKVSGSLNFVPGSDERWITVNIAQQRVTAYEHMKPVFTDLCSTGATPKGLTTRGIFAIDRRIANEIMDSTTIGFPQGHPKYYRLENVLYTQYFNGGEALHYAWWHNNFGQPMSFGCVNLRLNTARWFWDWANVGTRVVVA